MWEPPYAKLWEALDKQGLFPVYLCCVMVFWVCAYTLYMQKSSQRFPKNVMRFSPSSLEKIFKSIFKIFKITSSVKRNTWNLIGSLECWISFHHLYTHYILMPVSAVALGTGTAPGLVERGRPGQLCRQGWFMPSVRQRVWIPGSGWHAVV